MLKRIFYFIIDSIQAFVFALSIFILLYLFVAQPNQVNGQSMMPNFQDKEFLITDKIAYRFREPQRGEVVVFKAPPSEQCSIDECEYIKRIIGLPGEIIQVKDGKVYINGNPLKENYLPPETITRPGSFLREGKRYRIPQESYALFGDNREHSRDSREFGFVDRERIVGRAIFVYWPPQSFGLVKTSNFPD
jgi:signal peptidase I